MATKFKTQFAHDDSEKFMCQCKTPSKTEQQFEFELNINNIVNGAVQSALPSQTKEAVYGLKITGDEFETQLNATQEVLNYFEQLPIKAKEYFDYKPAEMLKFVQDGKNYEDAYKIGLIDKDTYLDLKHGYTEAEKSMLKNATVGQAVNTVTSGTEANQNTSNASD